MITGLLGRVTLEGIPLMMSRSRFYKGLIGEGERRKGSLQKSRLRNRPRGERDNYLDIDVPPNGDRIEAEKIDSFYDGGVVTEGWVL